jgi:serine protease DegQ
MLLKAVRAFLSKRSKFWWGLCAAVVTCATLLSTANWWHQPTTRVLTQADIDAAVLHTLSTKDLPSRTAKAAAIIAPSVVHVLNIAFDDEDLAEQSKAKPKNNAKNNKAKDDKNGKEKKNADESELPHSGIGSGVVISEDGKILTNWHVVQGAKKIIVTFADGTRSPAMVVGAQPENDLAVLKATKLPDDLQPATMGNSNALQPGEEVVAVGFPFGIGPSVSSGVVSGLNRHFKSEGNSLIKGLIQADAAANPGNSGGPLINMQGEVVGIITAILNPTQSRTFIGIVFATTIESAGTALGIPPF